MKINWQFLKKPSVIIGAIILFFILLFLLNKGSGASGGTQVVNAGPDPAQVAAQMQLAGMQISAGIQGQAIQADYAKSQDANQTQIALATIAAAANTQSLAVQQAIAAQTISAQTHGLDLQYQTALANNNFALDYAQQQFNYGLASSAINANLQAHMADNQLDAYKFGSALAVIPTLKKGDRDNALISVTLGVPSSHGSVLAPVTNSPSATQFSNIVNISGMTAAGQLT
jgi:hypothetical protein